MISKNQKRKKNQLFENKPYTLLLLCTTFFLSCWLYLFKTREKSLPCETASIRNTDFFFKSKNRVKNQRRIKANYITVTKTPRKWKVALKDLFMFRTSLKSKQTFVKFRINPNFVIFVGSWQKKPWKWISWVFSWKIRILDIKTSESRSSAAWTTLRFANPDECVKPGTEF